ncbi:osteoclast-associated immunoglobulin-like receptor, partial [Phasianus colchicus]|uniref:osteoclast-associated immunoglobulin-like receptor n=1 Tax=Phasianus colchicus TaxID=9054 RepID=UPI00129DF591
PSLSLHTSQGVSLGDNVTLRCHLPQPASRVRLCQEERFLSCMYKHQVQNMAEFSFVSTSKEHAGTYRCQYQVSEEWGAWQKSDPVELVLTDHNSPPPSISLSWEGCVEMGSNVTLCVETRTNVTIQCRNKDNGTSLLLHKDGCSAPVQRQDPDGAGTASFLLFGVTLADSGTYRCSSRSRNFPFVSSPLGDSVTLEVTPTPTPSGSAELVSHGNLVLVVVRGCAAALIFGLGIFFVIDARRHWIHR